MKFKLLFILSFIFFVQINAQSYIFGKISSEDLTEVPSVTVINMRTNEQVLTNRDGHFMVSGREGDILRFFKSGYDRIDRKVSKENVESPMNVQLTRAAQLIAEVEIKKGLSGDLKIDSKTLNQPAKVQKLKAEINAYLKQKSDPRILAARPGQFVQPKGQGFSVGKVKNKWDDLDFENYLAYALGEQYFADLKIEKPFINHFIKYVLAGGFERQKILKYGFVSDGDLMRFQNSVLMRISSYRAPQTQK
ncbi:hypothetical protein [Chryseobacterium luquanense]|uniref:CarboxypepD_reg-like domain-containing protein n=1 Tax=Chryseobacterium luquanense TaxID=2983766 RepID=A0ABT3Y1M8_9FLAO|nr:hypothetical protein [Chryseobacterium luquanense]MCX8532025.1 hypothetical protein [Chryseobacterium luquanense]